MWLPLVVNVGLGLLRLSNSFPDSFAYAHRLTLNQQRLMVSGHFLTQNPKPPPQAMVALMAMLFQNGTVGSTGPASWSIA